MNYKATFLNKGNQRVWLTLSLCWMFAAGWIGWSPLPEHQPVDVSQTASDLCRAETHAKAEEEGEKVYQACMAKNPDKVDTTANIPGLDAKKLCIMQRFASIAESTTKANPNDFECTATKIDELAKARQPEADRATDEKRIEQMARWFAITFGPPFALPIALALLIFVVSAAAKWIAAGYRDKR
jgi:hypothetical protein